MKAEKFDYNQAFDTSSKKIDLIKSDVVEKQVEDARDQAFTEGTEAGRSRTLAETDARATTALEHIANAAENLFLNLPKLEDITRKESALLAHAIAAKLSPALMRDRPLAEMEAMITECLDAAPEEQRIVIRTAEQLIEPLTQRLDGLKLSSGSNVAIILLADPELGEFDSRIEWPDGGLERKYEQISGKIDAAVKRYVTKEFEDGNATTEQQQSHAKDV